MNQDNSLVAMADTKEIKSLAEIMCDVAKHQGVTEIRIIDHSVQPKASVYFERMCQNSAY